MTNSTIEQVQEAHTEVWLTIPGVVGTAVGQQEGKPCILILTAGSDQQIREQIPHTVQGYPVVIRPTGEIHALDEP